MKNSQDHQNSHDIKHNHVSHDSHNELPNNAADTPIHDSGSVSATSNDNTKVSRVDIELVQNLIERCLQLYMNKDEVVKTLLNRARIDPGFTTLVWHKLEEENADFFRAYYIRLKLKRQIVLFNHLIAHQYNLMKYPVPPKVPIAPMHNGIHPMHVNNLPMGYPVMQPPVPATGQPHIDPMGYHTASTCQVVNGVPAPENFHPMRMHSGNDMAMDATTADMSPIMQQNNGLSSMTDMAVSPTSVASSGHFPFRASEVPVSFCATFTSDVASSVGLELPPDNGVGNSRDPFISFSQIPWNISLSDLTADLSNIGDLGALENYPGSPFLPSDSDILLGSQENLVEEYFVDSDAILGKCALLDEEKL